MKYIFDETSFKNTAQAVFDLNSCVRRDFLSVEAFLEYLKNKGRQMGEGCTSVATYGFIISAQEYNGTIYLYASVEGWIVNELFEKLRKLV